MKRIEKALYKLMENNCPSWIGEELSVDNNTRIFDKNGNVIGCRGITCIECWYQEYIERYHQEYNDENNTEDYDLIEDV